MEYVSLLNSFSFNNDVPERITSQASNICAFRSMCVSHLCRVSALWAELFWGHWSRAAAGGRAGLRHKLLRTRPLENKCMQTTPPLSHDHPPDKQRCNTYQFWQTDTLCAGNQIMILISTNIFPQQSRRNKAVHTVHSLQPNSQSNLMKCTHSHASMEIHHFIESAVWAVSSKYSTERAVKLIKTKSCLLAQEL